MYDTALSPFSQFPYITANSSFNEPVEVPPTDSTVGPFLCAHIPIAWMLPVMGALAQLTMPVAWQVTTEAEVDSIMGQVDVFLAGIANSSECQEMGSFSLTILAGAADASATVGFPTAFSATPVVVVSSSSEVLIASASAPTSAGFIATLTAATPVSVDTTATFSWIAGPVS